MPQIFLSHTPAARETWYGDKAVAQLLTVGEVVLHDGDQPLEGDDLIAAARDCDIIVADRATAGPGEVLKHLPRLTAFVRCAMDIRNVDVAAASALGILVTRASPGFGSAVAEWIVGQLINLARGLPRCATVYHEGGVPEPRLGWQLSGKTAGIVGYGNIGRKLAPILKAIGMDVLICDPAAKPNASDGELVDFRTLLARSDAVISLVPATPQTERLFDTAAFTTMKQGAVFINPARGIVVDEEALTRALDDGRLAAAALDVGDAPDNYPSPSLARRPNVLASPHIGGLTPEAIEHQALETVDQVRAIVGGKAPVGAVNAEAASRLRQL